MLIVDSQIHIWENGRMSAHHRQIPTYSKDDALKEMAEAGVDAAVIHPPSTLGEKVNELAVEAVKAHPDKFCILGHFDLQAPNREEIVRNWRQRPGMLGFRFTFNQPHQQSWWTDGSLDWFWKDCEHEELPVGLLAGGHMAAFRAIAERHPCLKLHIDHLGRHGGGTGGKDAAFRFMNALRLIRVSNNLGDSKSLITHPATTTHMRIGAEERARLGITDGVVRLSVGLEDVADLIDDLAEALTSLCARQAAE